MKGCFENNRVGQLQQRVWDANDAEIDSILASYEIPSPGEMDRPGCSPSPSPALGSIA